MAASDLSSTPFPTYPFQRAKINHQRPPPPNTDEVKTIPELINFNAKHNGNHVFCLQARKNTDPLAVTHSELKQAVLGCSGWLTENIKGFQLPFRDESGVVVKGRPVALLMESDVGLIIYLVSLLSLGVPPVLLSARLSPTAVQHLLVETNACVMIASPRLQNKAQEALGLFSDSGPRPALYSQVPYERFLTLSEQTLGVNLGSPEHYVADTDRNVLILHSSGTTGLPKPLFMTHRYTLCFTAAHDFPNEQEAQALVISTLPLYHGFGLVAPWLSLGIGKPFCLPISGTVPSGSAIESLLRTTGAKALMTVPSILQDIFQLPDERGIDTLLPLQFVAFGGGPLKESIGDKLCAAGVKLLNHYGATEVGPMAAFFTPPPGYNWRYFRLRKDMNLDLLPVDTPKGESQRYKLTAHPFGWGTSLELQDQLFTDPQSPGIDFATLGRKDDLIVLASGEKVVPAILETMLSESSAVKAALAFGENQFELGVIVEPAYELSTESVEGFKTLIWSVVMEAGDKMDAHARISSKDAIVIARPEKLLPRSDKGSIMRREAYRVFESEITKAYRDLESSTIGSSIPQLDTGNLEEGITDLIQTYLNWRIPTGEWGVEDDVFELGMDSLQALRLRRFLLTSFPPTRLPPDFVYQNPTVREMAKTLKKSSLTNGVNGHAINDKERIDECVREFSVPKTLANQKIKGAAILLTGSTGSLGSYILAHLASLPTVSRVICLNRPHLSTQHVDAQTRQRQSFATKGINISPEQWAKIKFLQTTTASSFLGLPESEYASLRAQVTHILHNAWPVDFKRALPSFKSQFQTLQNLLLLSQDIKLSRPQVKPRFMFISSITVVGQYGFVNGGRIIPEIPITDPKCTNPFGYGQAKLVCEQIVANAASEFEGSFEACSVRIGQMSASSGSGYWNPDEHMPALVKSSKKVGALPNIKGTLSWLPVDTTATVLAEILLSPASLKPIYHLENPVRQSWHDVLYHLSTVLNINQKVEIKEWTEKVIAADDEGNPAKVLGDFFRDDFEYMAGGSVILDTANARGVSNTLAKADMVSEADIGRCVDFWKREGFLQ